MILAVNSNVFIYGWKMMTCPFSSLVWFGLKERRAPFSGTQPTGGRAGN